MEHTRAPRATHPLSPHRQEARRQGAAQRGDRARAAAPGAGPLSPQDVLLLQRSVGNRATGQLLARRAAGPAVIQRAPTYTSMEGAWNYLKDQEDGVTIVSFLTRVLQSGSKGIQDSHGGWFTASDLGAMLKTAEGRKFVTSRWRDTAGEAWGNQVRQGQHERIPTNNVPVILGELIGAGKIDQALQFLAAADMLRDPTSTVYLGVDIKQKTLDDINNNPIGYTASTIGVWKHHSQGLFGPRTKPTPSGKTDTYQQFSKGSTSFHKQLDKIVHSRVSGTKFELSELMQDLHKDAEQKYWSGDIPGLNAGIAQQIPSDLRASSKVGSELHGRLGLKSELKEGELHTTFSRPQNLAEIQQAAKEAKELNQQTNLRRANALLTMLPNANDDLPESTSYWGKLPQEAVLYPKGEKTVEDYDKLYAEAKLKGDTKLVEELEQDYDMDEDDDTPPPTEWVSVTAPRDVQPQPPQQPPPLSADDQRVQAFIGQVSATLTQSFDARLQQLGTAIQAQLQQTPQGFDPQKAYQDGLQQLQQKYGGIKAQLDSMLQDYERQKQQLALWRFQNEPLQWDRAAFYQQVREKSKALADSFIAAVQSALPALLG